MTKDVLVTIKGMQRNSDEESVITSAKGIYQLRESAHYLRYEEALLEEHNPSSKTRIKITPKRISITRQGTNASQMIFDRNEITQSVYHTPYGSLQLEIYTRDIVIEEEPDQMIVTLDYQLSENGTQLSDNRTIISITSSRK